MATRRTGVGESGPAIEVGSGEVSVVLAVRGPAVVAPAAISHIGNTGAMAVLCAVGAAFHALFLGSHGCTAGPPRPGRPTCPRAT